jgi:microcystin-dependent protein
MAVDADAYYPFASGAGQIETVAQWEDYAGDLLRDGVILGAASEHAVFADSTGMQVKVPTGRVCIRGHRGVLTSQKTLGISANGSGNTRIDRVVARLDVTNSKIVYDVLAGTPSGSPVAPALTQTSTTWELALAQVSVPPSDTTIDSGQVTDERTFAFPLGGKNVGDAYVSFRTTVANSAEVFLQGQVVSRVTYAGLFALWGTTHGAGDGVTTFRLPNAQGKVLVGRDASDADFSTIGAAVGEKKHIVQQSELPNAMTGDADRLHTHATAIDVGLKYDPVSPVGFTVSEVLVPFGRGIDPASSFTSSPQSTGHLHPLGGGASPMNVVQPSLVCNWAVRAR